MNSRGLINPRGKEFIRGNFLYEEINPHLGLAFLRNIFWGLGSKVDVYIDNWENEKPHDVTLKLVGEYR